MSDTKEAHAKQLSSASFVIKPLSRLRRAFYLGLGLLSLGVAYLGWILPGLPFTPFVLTASWCFGKSSPRLQRMLLNNRLFGSYLRDYHVHRGIRQKTKIYATVMVILIITCSMGGLIWAQKPWYLWALIPFLGLIGLLVLWKVVKTLPNDTPPIPHA